MNARKSHDKAPQTEDAKLDEALEESFPASDPPSQTDPHVHVMSKRRGKKHSGQSGTSRTES